METRGLRYNVLLFFLFVLRWKQIPKLEFKFKGERNLFLYLHRWFHKKRLRLIKICMTKYNNMNIVRKNIKEKIVQITNESQLICRRFWKFLYLPKKVNIKLEKRVGNKQLRKHFIFGKDKIYVRIFLRTKSSKFKHVLENSSCFSVIPNLLSHEYLLKNKGHSALNWFFSLCL